MGQFIVALLIGGFFSLIVGLLQYTILVAEEVEYKLNNPQIEEEPEFETYVPFSANVFLSKNKDDWLFTDKVILNIINYFRSELQRYKGDFTKEESIELSHILYDKTPVIEHLVSELKRGKPDDNTFNEVINASFSDYSKEKLFLLRTVFCEVQNTLITNLITSKHHATSN